MTRMTLLFSLLAAMLFSGCGINDLEDSNVTISVRVSSLVYHGDDNETNTTFFTIGADNIGNNYADSDKELRNAFGRWDFYDANISGERRIENSIFLLDVNCSDFNRSAYTPAAAPVMKAPATGSSRYAFLNVNPFTTLMVDLNLTAQSLSEQFDFPAAYRVDEDFNFDTYSAINDRTLQNELSDYNLTDEVCRALKMVLEQQNLL